MRWTVRPASSIGSTALFDMPSVSLAPTTATVRAERRRARLGLDGMTLLTLSSGHNRRRGAGCEDGVRDLQLDDRVIAVPCGALCFVGVLARLRWPAHADSPEVLLDLERHDRGRDWI